jgi:hypothetical protein
VKHAFAPIALLSCLATTASASTFVIDDNAGPGVDFTAIQPAIDAAAPGDVLLVKAGSYSWFTLSKGLSILGESGVSVFFADVDGVPSGQVAVLTDFQTQTLFVWSSDGTVIVQRVTGCEFHTYDSRDVRLLDVEGEGHVGGFKPPGQPPSVGAALQVQGSRIEAVQSTFVGHEGPDDDDMGYPGFPAVVAGYQTLGEPLPAVVGLLHLSLSSATGGRGGIYFGSVNGPGGAGVLVSGPVGCDVVIAGGSVAFIRGGAGGSSPFLFPCNPGGPSIRVEQPEVRYSGVELLPGLGCDGLAEAVVANDPDDVDAPGYVDPTLGVSGSATAGGLLTFEIHGHPRSKAFLNYGKTPIVQSDSFSEIGTLVDTIRGIKLGAIPVSGSIDRAFPIPSNAAVGSLFVFQGVVVLPNGELRRTNSVPVIVR